MVYDPQVLLKFVHANCQSYFALLLLVHVSMCQDILSMKLVACMEGVKAAALLGMNNICLESDAQ